MRKLLIIGALIAGLYGLVWTSIAAGDSAQVPYPENYRTWQHLKTMLIQPGHALENPFAGIHHIYGNELAMQGQQMGSYADGSIFVFDLLEYEDVGNAIVESTRKLVGVMQRDEQAYGDTGGWGFEGFAGSSKTERLVSDGGSSCYGCHTSVESSSFVFTKYRP